MSWKPGLNENLFCFEGFTTHFMKFIAEGLQIIKIDFVSSNPSEPALSSLITDHNQSVVSVSKNVSYVYLSWNLVFEADIPILNLLDPN